MDFDLDLGVHTVAMCYRNKLQLVLTMFRTKNNNNNSLEKLNLKKKNQI